MSYAVRLARPVPKQLDAIPKKDYQRIYQKLRGLAEDQRPRGSLKLEDDLYRIRSGAYRIIYAILEEQQTVLVVKIARRSEKTYRNLG